MVDLVEEQGNALLYSAEVEEILVRNGAARGVRLTDGNSIDADVVVSNADPAWTYSRMLPGIRRRRWSDRKLRRARFSNGLFVWYFGTKRRYEDVPHHSILLGPRYRGLLDDIFHR